MRRCSRRCLAGLRAGAIIVPISYDAADLTQSSFDISVDVDSIDTRNANRDKDLKGPDFFDVKQFPAMKFKSTSVKKTGDNTMDVTGDLTLKGVTKSIKS